MNLIVTSFVGDKVKFIGNSANKVYNETLYMKDTTSNMEYAIILANAPNNTKQAIITLKEDYDIGNTLSTLYVKSNGYAYYGNDDKDVLLHTTILGPTPNGKTVDHINWQKTDNRIANLRAATQAQQNMNRPTRSDKLPPMEALLALGVFRLPRRVRWDSGEEKFVIELPTTSISGTKSAKVSIPNKFRDILIKFIALLEEEPVDDFINMRIHLANEYNQIIRASHMANPIFPDGPYIDVEEMCSDMQYCKYCLGMLPVPDATEVLHGPRSVASGYRYIDELDVVLLEKDTAKIFIDRKYEHLLRMLPACDISSSSPLFPSSKPLQQCFPTIVTNDDISKKKKYTFKELIWRGWMNNTMEEDHSIVPLNYMQYDLRSENLRMLPGASKSFQAPATFEIPREYNTDMKYWPRGIVLQLSDTRKWCLSAKHRNGDGKIENKKMSCDLKTVSECLGKAILHLNSVSPGYIEENIIFQKLLCDFFIAVSTA